ncbi:MAG: 4Fe-4S dicluster domain-containing protein [Acidaminococcaceae bacterium]
MSKIAELMLQEATQLLTTQAVDAVLAWRRGEMGYDPAPAFFRQAEELTDLVYNEFCGSNLSKYLLAASQKGERVAVFLKPCDTYSLNQLLQDGRVQRELVTVIGIPCGGMLDIKQIKDQGIKGVKTVTVAAGQVTLVTAYGTKVVPQAAVLLRKCTACKGNEYKIADLELGDKLPVPPGTDRFAQVRALEQMTAAQRFSFWQKELSKCIRCNACRDICPACSCEQCIFDNPQAAVAGKANANSAEEQMFHIIRAFHVAGRCTDCGECARVCPQGIPLDLLNRKFILDINEIYGEYQAGATSDAEAPLLKFDPADAESTIVSQRRG